MAGDLARIADVLRQAHSNLSLAMQLREDLASTLREHGLLIPEEHDAAYREVWHQIVEPGSSASVLAFAAQSFTFPFLPVDDCTACQIAVTGVAIALVAIGIGGVLGLSATAQVVVQLASVLGIGTAQALELVQAAAPAIGDGVSAVTRALCSNFGACR